MRIAMASSTSMTLVLAVASRPGGQAGLCVELPDPVRGSRPGAGGHGLVRGPGQPSAGRRRGGATVKPKVSKVKTVRGTSASLKVQVPGKGVIGVSGSGLAAASKQASKAGSYTVTARLSKAAQRTLARKHRLTVRVTVRFAPTAGKASSANVSVTFVPAKARRATVLSSVSRKGR